MRRGGGLLGVLLVVLGIVLLVGTLSGIDVWGLAGSTLLIVFGAWILWGVLRGRRAMPVEEVSIPLDGVQQARVHVGFGAGQLRVGGGAAAGELMAGTFRGGVNYSKRQQGQELEVGLTLPNDVYFLFPIPGIAPGGLEWSVRLTPDIPLALRVETGASTAELDLTDLRVTDLRLVSGVNSAQVKLPARAGRTKVRVEGGLGSLKVWVPEGVAAQIRSRGGLSAIHIDRSRFPRSGRAYQSTDYETAANKVELDVQIALGSVEIY
jgi:hypothetical protein